MHRAGVFSGKLLLVFWALIGGVAIGSTPSVGSFQDTNLTIQAIDGSGVQAIDGSGLQAIDGSGTRAHGVYETRAIDGSGIHGIHELFMRFWYKFLMMH